MQLQQYAIVAGLRHLRDRPTCSPRRHGSYRACSAGGARELRNYGCSEAAIFGSRLRTARRYPATCILPDWKPGNMNSPPIQSFSESGACAYASPSDGLRPSLREENLTAPEEPHRSTDFQEQARAMVERMRRMYCQHSTLQANSATTASGRRPAM